MIDVEDFSYQQGRERGIKEALDIAGKRVKNAFTNEMQIEANLTYDEIEQLLRGVKNEYRN